MSEEYKGERLASELRIVQESTYSQEDVEKVLKGIEVKPKDNVYGIYRVYYDASGNIIGKSKNPLFVITGNSSTEHMLQDFRKAIERSVGKAFDKETLSCDEFKDKKEFTH